MSITGYGTPTKKEKELIEVMLSALESADAEFTEEEICNALGYLKGAILTVMFKKDMRN